MDDVALERLLRCVEQVPPGRVVSYGDVGRVVGAGPRQVGQVMSRWGGNVPWWRVTNHAGDLPRELLARARPRWDAEGIRVKPNGLGCRIADYRADLDRLAADWARAVADLDDERGGAVPGSGPGPAQ